MRASADALPPFEIAVRGARAALPRCELVRIHAEAHGAAGIAPFKSGFEQNAVQAFALGLFFHLTGTRHPQRLNALRHFSPLRDLGRGANILDTAVGAGTDKDHVDLYV